MSDKLERTDEAQRGFDGMKTRITVVDGADGLTPDMLRVSGPLRLPHQDPMHDGPGVGETKPIAYVGTKPIHNVEDLEREMNGAAMDPFEDDTPVAQTCNTENPEACEACD